MKYLAHGKLHRSDSDDDDYDDGDKDDNYYTCSLPFMV